MAMYPRAMAATSTAIMAVCLAVAVERQWRLASIDGKLLSGRNDAMPNYHHVWWAHDLLFMDSRLPRNLNMFGVHVEKAIRHSGTDLSGIWRELCPLDSDLDNFTNGEELGDPCCLWSREGRGGPFELSGRREYRRWALTHPGGNDKREDVRGIRLSPADCGSYDPARYAEDFRKFYFRRHDGPFEPTPVLVVKVISIAVFVVLLVHWARARGLLADIAPVASSKPRISGRLSFIVMLLSWVYMDLTSGMVHLVLDYLPHWIPVLGDLAKGFQHHHHDPTAIIRISWYAYVSHVHLLCPLIAAMLLFCDASRVQRLFWFWGAVFVHAFQTTHRWAHFPPEVLSWPVRFGQRSGLLLTHERHMNHHEDLEKQFTILSGYGDLLLDSAAALVPPIRYDLWLCLTVVWFLLPMALDVKFRQYFESLELARPKQGQDELGIALRNLDA
uniref:Lipid desaturase domain-containing protein n=1 Tax=Alexandrium catenella TaxID=2925 RepID=A0A7S1M5F5_ALECA|mmetsp:Transcript_2030/g.5400  ORF Transcript_2030/g.5400 Transcript_2030/m.5400 type:complete len:444 (+) Transcript_2030:116-1447(+)|eukprot:CAMPEP_0171182260 /NCGR_PEP_ID=MMETSP0790-20130122/14677_1 /TAXON_ID=2925 /ORGANISM="Alexandrium catenella, Strain OF101" /LENGTH=443 /DNA_ID=CAMNT_0011647211 /DNA_START=93 /DNA_END=1424 /DNA_ORIENTATION=+